MRPVHGLWITAGTVAAVFIVFPLVWASINSTPPGWNEAIEAAAKVCERTPGPKGARAIRGLHKAIP